MIRERVEDLGVISEKFTWLFDEYEDIFLLCTSKHEMNDFIDHYSNVENLANLQLRLRYFREMLEEIYYIARGEDSSLYLN